MAFAYTLEGASGLGQMLPSAAVTAAEKVTQAIAAEEAANRQRWYWAIGGTVVGLVAGIFIGRAIR